MASIVTKLRRGLRKDFQDWDFIGHDDNGWGIFYYAFESHVVLEGYTSNFPCYINFRFTDKGKNKVMTCIDFEKDIRWTYEFGDMDVKQKGDTILLSFNSGEEGTVSIELRSPVEYSD